MPKALESENTIIALMLLYPGECIGKVIEKLSVDDFVSDKNKEIFKVIKDLYLNENKEIIDYAMLINELERRGIMEKIGGADYLIGIMETFYSTPELLDEHINIVLEKSIYRRIIETSQIILNEAQKEERKADDLLDFAEARILEIRDRGIRKDFVHISDIVEAQKEEIVQRYEVKSKIIGLPSGISFLDNLTGGFLPGNLIIIASRPSVGKTSFALFIHRYLSVDEKIPTAIFSLEMSANELVQRFISMQSYVSNMKIRTGMLGREDFPKIIEAIGRLRSAQIWIDDSAISLLEIKAKARRIVKEQKVKLITIDYLQLIELEPHERKRRESRQQEVAYITRSLKSFAKEINIPIVVLSQLSRKAEERADKKPQLSDLRESGCLTGDSLIIRADTGERVPIKELVGKEDIPVFSIDENYKICISKARRIFYSGRKMVYELKTRSGRKIKASANHPFLTIEGWKRLDELKMEDNLALPMDLKPNADIFWDRIVSIEEIGIDDVYDATVEGTHNFVANDIIVHNSIEQDADIVILLYRNKELSERVVGVNLAKNRNGPIGEDNFIFESEYFRFTPILQEPSLEENIEDIPFE